MSLTKVSYSMINGAVYNVLDFGAVGDGVTDDTTAIQNALDYAYDAGGGKVYLPTGTYKTLLPLIVLSNVTFEGDGASSVIYQCFNSGVDDAGNGVHIGYGAGWGLNGAPDPSISDATIAELLAFDYSKLTTVNASVKNLTVKALNGTQRLGVWTINSLNCLIENIWGDNWRTPVNVANDNSLSPGACANTTINNVFQVSSAQVGSWFDVLFVGNSINTIVSGLQNNPNTPTALQGAINLSGAYNVTISNCVFRTNPAISASPGGKYGIEITSNSNNVTVNNCVFQRCTVGVSVGDATGPSNNVSIAGNVFETCYIGIQLLDGGRIVTSPNSFFDSSFADVYDSGGSSTTLGSKQFEYIQDKRTYVYGTSGATLATYYDVAGNFIAGGTSADNSKLTATFDGATNNGVLFNNTSAILTGQFAARFKQNGTVVGSIQTTGTTTVYLTSSDYRLKEDVKPMENALNVIDALKPVTYKWKLDGSRGQGFIAHELQEVMPECVSGSKDATTTEEYEITPSIDATFDKKGNQLTPAVPAVIGTRTVPAYQGIDTSFIVATLTAAIQELKAEIDVLKGAK